jgi:hypothetical protein
MMENYSAILKTYNDGTRKSYVIPTDLAKKNGLYGGYTDEEFGITVECENFETCAAAVIRSEDWEEEK